MLTEVNGVKTETETGIKEKDKVFVKEIGKVFSTYASCFDDNGFTDRYERFMLPATDRVYEVKKLIEHPDSGAVLAFVELTNHRGLMYLIGVNGLEPVSNRYPNISAPINVMTNVELKGKALQYSLGICPSDDKEHLTRETIEVLEQYNYTPTQHAIEKIIDAWASNKGNLISRLMMCDGYVEGKFMVSYMLDTPRKFDDAKVRAFFNALEGMVRPLCATYAKQEDGTYNEHLLPDTLKNEVSFDVVRNSFLIKSDSLLGMFLTGVPYYIDSQFVDERLEDYLNNYNGFSALRIVKGQKVSKAINKICTYFGFDRIVEEETLHNGSVRQYKPYDRCFAELSDAVNPINIKRRFILSCHPVDYLLMSNGNSWASCHTIDKHNTKQENYNGCYSSGTMSYLLDGASLVSYELPETTPENNDFELEEKVLRQMYHIGEEKFVQGRLYPQSNDRAAEDVYTTLRKTTQKIVAQMFGYENMWETEKGTDILRQFTESYGTHYKDYTAYDSCTLSRLAGSHNIERIKIGHDPICIECGQEHSCNEWITCCSAGNNICHSCGRSCDEDDLHYIDGNWYCDDCCDYDVGYEDYTLDEVEYVRIRGTAFEESYSVTYLESNCTRCDDCGEYMFNDEAVDAINVDGEEIIVCQDCIETGDYYYCECCDRYTHYNYGQTTSDGTFICDDCAKTEGGVCEKCGCFELKVDMCQTETGYLCSDCHDKCEEEREAS